MKTLTRLSASILMMLFAVPVFGQTAEVQIIHNSPDPGANQVDVYVETPGTGTFVQALDNFPYLSASEFLDLPAGLPFTIGIAPGNSIDVNDTIYSVEVTLQANETYLAFASGLLQPSNYSIPAGRDVQFGVNLIAGASNSSGASNETDLLVYHGSPDAPVVDIEARNTAILADDADYNDNTNVISVPNNEYLIDLYASVNDQFVTTFTADLSPLGGQGIVVFASGFINQAQAGSNPFGLYVAYDDGSQGVVAPLNEETLARIQIIHNSPDPAASTVDVYLNDNIFLNDFDFRTATPLQEVATGNYTVGIAGGTSNSVDDTLKSWNFPIRGKDSLIVFAEGVLDPTVFANNPDGKDISLDLLVNGGTRSMARSSGNVEMEVYHGSPDAPTVDVLANRQATLVNDIAFGEVNGNYLSVPATEYLLDVTDQNSTLPAFFTYIADLSALGDSAIAVFASGFVDSAANNDGPSFGLFAVLRDGSVIQIEEEKTVNIQVLHNSPDPAVETVDIYAGDVNEGTLILDDVDFRSASAFTSYEIGNGETRIGFAPSSSTSYDDTLATIPLNFITRASYILVADGVLSPDDFADNPDGVSTGFSLAQFSAIEQGFGGADSLSARIYHGSPDAPTVDIQLETESDFDATIDNAGYRGSTQGYLNIPAEAYDITVWDEARENELFTFEADLSILGDSSAFVFASGFVNPDDNQDGESFGLFGLIPNGTVIPFTNTTGFTESPAFSGLELFPNPAIDRSTLKMGIEKQGNVRVSLLNQLGQEVKVFADEEMKKGNYEKELDLSGVNSGVYFVKIAQGNSQSVSRIIVQ